MDGIREAVQADIPQVAAIYDRILTEEEQGRAVVGWIRGVYPTERTARDALAAGTLFVLEQEGKIAAAAKIDRNQVPEYDNAPWRYPDAPDSQVMVLHTLVVDPAFAGRGCGKQFVAFYEEHARACGCPYLRMDTNAKNAAARRLYSRLGYWEVGIVPCAFNGIPDVQLVCLEKKL
jgi:ribosomal protein S18 acetylase RimI-like enzyme